eukprot:TRINITY_DN6560_c0_g2_i2.p1 TRINITY_DN6560_c0_g2~~TRINITY_DN6560_c0_g2_i2.p1  ORF type:complete len:801 (-),score=239.94 TRINITY_DN6560_c0_g2_i2:42-2444(-)
MNIRESLYNFIKDNDLRVKFEKHLENIYTIQNWEFWKSLTEIIDNVFEETMYITKLKRIIDNYISSHSNLEISIEHMTKNKWMQLIENDKIKEDPTSIINISRRQIEKLLVNDILSFQNHNNTLDSNKKEKTRDSIHNVPSCQALLVFQFVKMRALAEKLGQEHLIECYSKILLYEKETSPTVRYTLAKNIFEEYFQSSRLKLLNGKDEKKITLNPETKNEIIRKLSTQKNSVIDTKEEFSIIKLFSKAKKEVTQEIEKNLYQEFINTYMKDSNNNALIGNHFMGLKGEIPQVNFNNTNMGKQSKEEEKSVFRIRKLYIVLENTSFNQGVMNTAQNLGLVNDLHFYYRIKQFKQFVSLSTIKDSILMAKEIFNEFCDEHAPQSVSCCKKLLSDQIDRCLETICVSLYQLSIGFEDIYKSVVSALSTSYESRKVFNLRGTMDIFNKDKQDVYTFNEISEEQPSSHDSRDSVQIISNNGLFYSELAPLSRSPPSLIGEKKYRSTNNIIDHNKKPPLHIKQVSKSHETSSNGLIHSFKESRNGSAFSPPSESIEDAKLDKDSSDSESDQPQKIIPKSISVNFNLKDEQLPFKLDKSSSEDIDWGDDKDPPYKEIQKKVLITPTLNRKIRESKSKEKIVKVEIPQVKKDIKIDKESSEELVWSDEESKEKEIGSDEESSEESSKNKIDKKEKKKNEMDLNVSGELIIKANRNSSEDIDWSDDKDPPHKASSLLNLNRFLNNNKNENKNDKENEIDSISFSDDSESNDGSDDKKDANQVIKPSFEPEVVPIPQSNKKIEDIQRNT